MNKCCGKIIWNILVILIIIGVLTFYGVPKFISAQGGAPASGLGPGSQNGPPRALPVETAPVRVGTVNVAISAVGSLLANESVMIRPEIAGRIIGVHFSEGQRVAKDAELITLDAAELRAQAEEGASSVKLNKLSFERARELSSRKLMSRQEYDQAQANLSEAQARQNLNDARLSKTVLRAPFEGVLGLRKVSPGDYVQPGEDIVNLEDIGALKLDFRIPELYLSKIKPDQIVEVRVDAFPDTTFTGQVYAIEPGVDVVTRSILLRARIPNDDGKLRPGMFARITLILEQRPNALLIPEHALVPMGNDRFVYRVVDGKAVQQKVSVGERRAGEVEISTGLSPGDTVVTDGQMKIKDGAPVTVMQAADGKAPARTSEQRVVPDTNT
ncbi:MAG: efflux RND transporter periplasmic adaptor subunit, partial [Gammaproteobacteria bacterium]